MCQYILEIAVQGVQSILPGITFVRYQSLKGSESHHLALPTMILEGTSYLRNMREISPFCEKTTDFQLGVNSLLQAAK